jgi:serine/threonine protein kinase
MLRLSAPRRIVLSIHTYELAAGLAYMHTMHMSHRDIKPDNIMMDRSGTIKLIDFGLAQIEYGTTGGAGGGTRRYMAPELFQDEGGDEKVDVYAFAVVVWEWYSRQLMWVSDSPEKIAERMKKKERPNLLDTRLHEYTMSYLIAECWDDDKNMRPRMQNVSYRLGLIKGGFQSSVIQCATCWLHKDRFPF